MSSAGRTPRADRTERHVKTECHRQTECHFQAKCHVHAYCHVQAECLAQSARHAKLISRVTGVQVYRMYKQKRGIIKRPAWLTGFTKIIQNFSSSELGLQTIKQITINQYKTIKIALQSTVFFIILYQTDQQWISNNK